MKYWYHISKNNNPVRLKSYCGVTIYNIHCIFDNKKDAMKLLKKVQGRRPGSEYKIKRIKIIKYDK